MRTFFLFLLFPNLTSIEPPTRFRMLFLFRSKTSTIRIISIRISSLRFSSDPSFVLRIWQFWLKWFFENQEAVASHIKWNQVIWMLNIKENSLHTARKKSLNFWYLNSFIFENVSKQTNNVDRTNIMSIFPYDMIYIFLGSAREPPSCTYRWA